MDKLLDLRQFNKNDAQVFAALRNEANADRNYRGNRDPELDISLGEAESLILNTNTIVIGAFHHDHLVGMVSLGWMIQNFTLFGLFVSTDFRRESIGQQLVSKAIAEVKALGAKTIKLEVARSNRAAIALYEKMGFSCIRRDSESLKLIMVIPQQTSVV